MYTKYGLVASNGYGFSRLSRKSRLRAHTAKAVHGVFHIHERLPYFAQKQGVEYRRVFIRDQSSIWGSCSPSKNLSFNLRLAALSSEQADYIIVHELCHLKEMNHSKSFWKLVESVLPNYQERRREVKKISINK